MLSLPLQSSYLEQGSDTLYLFLISLRIIKYNNNNNNNNKIGTSQHSYYPGGKIMTSVHLMAFLLLRTGYTCIILVPTG